MSDPFKPLVSPQAQIAANKAQEKALDWAMTRLFPDWRVEELARKYAPEDAYDRDEYHEDAE